MAKKMKLFEKLFLFTVAVATTATMVWIPFNSYMEYQDYLAGLEQVTPGPATKKPVLEKIEAKLLDGVQYFANDMAEAKAEDFEVIAHYTVEGEDPYTETVEAGKFSVQTAADFYAKGGDVTISFRGKVATVPVTLVPVTLESINVTMTPYTIKYAAGSTFSNAGMIVNAVYNDGSTKELSEDEYVVDTETALKMGDKFIDVSYKEGDVEKKTAVEIGVSETLDNGAVESIVIVDGAIVNAGEHITDAVMEVNAVYESGNRVPLTSEEYTINGLTEAVEFGKMYELEVVYNADNSKKAETDVVVRQTIQGEDGVIVGGSVKTETEYKVINGAITEMENSVTFAGNFSNSVKNGKEGSLTLSLNSATETIGDITMRCSNSYNVYANGNNADDGYMMKPLQINTILDLTINGREVKVPTTVILKGCGPWETYAPLYGIYYEFTFEDIALDAGLNEIKFNFKNSTNGAANCWGESPSTLNIDYVNIDSVGSEIPETYTIEAIEISEMFAPEYAQNFEDVNIPFIATLDNGTRIGLDSSLVNIEITGGAEGDTYFKFGEYTIKASLKSNPNVKTDKTVKIEEFNEFVILNADIVVEGEKVYYVFSGDSVGYTTEDLIFFDGATNYEFTVDFTATGFTLKIDVTELATGTQIYPHMKVDGSNYENGSNSNGDVRGNGLQFTDGKSVTLGDKTYTLVTAWSMPTLLIEQYVNPSTATEIKIADSYEAKFGDALADIPVVAIINGEEVALNSDAYTIEIVGNESATTLGEGTYTIKVTLVADTELTDEITVTLTNPNKKFYDAELNDEFVSEKALVNTYVHGSEGMDTNGANKNSEYEGGTGGIDQIDRHVTYTFTLTEDGYVDIIFNVAGNYWKSNKNQGLTDMANNIEVTIDGRAVDVSGIALPAGEGDNEWWNVKQIVIKDVALAAGTHTFKAVCITKGQGLNVASMELYFAADEIPEQPDTPVVPDEPEDVVLVTGADLVVEGEKVYYVFTFKNVGYTVEDYEFFDGETVYAIADSKFEGETAIIKIDVTSLEVGATIDPHLRVAGANYVNGSNTNGDIRGESLVYTPKFVDYGDKVYQLYTNWSMPSLKVVDKIFQGVAADIAIENDKVYWSFTFEDVGYNYNPEEYEIFDGTVVYPIESYSKNGTTVTIKINVTDVAADLQVYPHLRIGAEGVKPTHTSGDLLVAESGYTNGKSVELNGKIYKLVKSYGMPTLKVEAAPVVEEHTHELSEVAKVEPGCETTGTEAYYTCSGCDKLFSDAEGTTEIPAPVTIDATGHNWSTELKEGVDGFYYECLNGCGETQSAEVPSVEGYQATLNNEFVSTKENELVLTYKKYGANGITTNGSYKQETGAPAGAIGGLDAAGKYVKYEFVMDKAGTVDFIWSIAGSWYNGTNAGLTDMGAHMSVTIDGKSVNIAGIALPAGEGDYLWWNLQKVVVKDVILEAGVHTLECQVTTAGGLNVGDLTIKSTKAVNAREAVATGADIVLEGDKVYYVFTFRNVGYTVEDYKFFNGDATYEIAASTFEGNTAIIKIDVTALEVGTTIDPHLKLAGKNYVNDANVNGDLRGDSIVYQNGKVVGLNDKYYQLYTNWSMPSLKVITKACQAVAADIVVEGDKVYYTFTFENIGYNPAEYEFFDGQTIYAVSSYKENGTKVTFKLDVTEVAAGTQIYPHVRINGEMPTHKSGDLLVDASGYENNKSVTLGDKTYTLVKSYGMPTLKVAVVTA